MKILLVQNLLAAPAYGGADRANQAFLEELAGRNHECRVIARSAGLRSRAGRQEFLDDLALHGISLSAACPAVDIFRFNGVEVHALADLFQMRDYLAEQIRVFEPAWVLVSSEDPGQILLKAALELCPERVIYLAHTPQAFPFGADSCAPNPAGAEMLRRVAAIVAIGRRTAAYVERHIGRKPVVFHPQLYGRGPFPRYGRFDHGFVTLVNPSEINGVGIFLALARLFPRVQFAALPGSSTGAAERAAFAELPNVRVLPPLADLDQVFAQTRLLLVPSLYQEGFGVMVVEAMLRAIPVLVSDVGGLLDAKLGVDYALPVRPIARYEPRFNGHSSPTPVVPEQDIGPWEVALRRLTANRAHYERLAADSRAAALAFVSSLDNTAFATFLERLAPAAWRHDESVARQRYVGAR